MAGFGETLRQARAHKGVSLKEAEQATRITRHYLAALEEEDFSSLPPVIYQRGFVRNYSIFLDLDPSKTLALFEEAQGSTARPANQSVTAVPPIDMPSHWAPNFAIIAFSVVLSAIVFAWVYTAYVAPPTNERDATPPLATVTPYDNDIALPTQPRVTETPQPTATIEPADASAVATEQRSGGGDNQLESVAETVAPETTPDSGDTTGGDNARETDSEPTAEPTEEVQPTETTEATAEPTQYTKVGEFDTTIEITADSDIYVSFWTDGNLVFDGNLAAGESTGAFPGSSFRIYTSSGASTSFTNGCGESFYYGDEGGEATYEFGAGPESCAVDPAKLDNN
jgi:cytoskeletal protein RodZ